jgi:hypothetical protein
MDRTEIVKQVNRIYQDYYGYFCNVSDYSGITSYKEYSIFKQKDDLYLVLENVSGIDPLHDLKLYCKIPKNKNELTQLMFKLGYVENHQTEQMNLNTLNFVYKHLEDKLDFLEKNRPNSKSIIGMELACQFVFDLIASNGEGVKK